MLDVHHLGGGPVADVQTFTRLSTATDIQWLTWLKPRGVSMVHMYCVGGGGGGGNGNATAAGAWNKRGGGGGGSSAQTSLLIAAHLLPDRLFVQVGAGGQQGLSGMLSYVSVDSRGSTANNIVCVSGTAGAAGGQSANSSFPGAGGNAGSVAGASGMPIGAGLGIFNAITGQVGVGGGDGSAGGSQTLATNGCAVQGGSGGGGSNFGISQAGGGVVAVANTLVSDSGPAAAVAGSTAGSGGYTLRGTRGYFYVYGGMGGASPDTAPGGNGGNGLYGGGGGGGGGGTTAGIGGTGGSGIVIITSW